MLTKRIEEFRQVGAEIRRDWWESRRDLERTEGVRRCFFCGAREDRHNLPADMAYYRYEAHDFEYATEQEIQEWSKPHAD